MQLTRRSPGDPRPRTLSVMAGLALALASCIERSNPFDPANQRSALIEEIRKQLQPGLDSLAQASAAAAQGLGGFRDGYRKDSLANVATEASNQGRKETNATRLKANAAVDSGNALQTDPAALLTQVEYVLLDTMKAYGPYPGLDSAFNRIRESALQTAAIMAAANDKATTSTEIYPRALRDSLLAPFVRDSAAFATLRSDIEIANSEIAVANQAIREYNGLHRILNRAILEFNAQVEFRKQVPRAGVITNADTLLKATVAAKAGDTLLIGPGTLLTDLRFNSGNESNPIVIRGYPGWKTILRPRPAGAGKVANHTGIIQGHKHIRFEDIVFRGGAISGMKLDGDARNISFRRCLFDSSGTWGVEASRSDLKLIDCEIRANGGGIRIALDSTSSYELVLDNVLIVQNRGRGIEAVTPRGEISHSTISDNGAIPSGDGDGIHIASHQNTLKVRNTILSTNREYGIFRDPTLGNQDGLAVNESNLWGNLIANWSLRNLDSTRARDLMSKNLEVEPRFVNPAAFDYSLVPGSELAEYEKLPLPVVIGYRRKQ